MHVLTSRLGGFAVYPWGTTLSLHVQSRGIYIGQPSPAQPAIAVPQKCDGVTGPWEKKPILHPSPTQLLRLDRCRPRSEQNKGKKKSRAADAQRNRTGPHPLLTRPVAVSRRIPTIHRLVPRDPLLNLDPMSRSSAPPSLHPDRRMKCRDRTDKKEYPSSKKISSASWF